jgi:serine O-acetyltransferase
MESPSMTLYRFAHTCHKYHIPLLGRLISYFMRFVFSAWIPYSAKLGKNVRLGYWGIGVVIHSRAEIGNNCLISQNVTIGRNKEYGVPRIGNNVYIAAGAVIAGDIEIGNNVIIGANAFVNKSVPSDVIVGGIPAKVLRPVADGEIEIYLKLTKRK